VTTRRTAAQLRVALVRIAQAASQIVACYERFGPDEPWGFADPGGVEMLAALLHSPRALPGRRRAVAGGCRAQITGRRPKLIIGSSEPSF
jgi:hypothetical protein